MIIDQTQVPGRATILTYFILFSVFVVLVMTEVMGLLPSSDVKRGVGIVLALMLAVTGNFLPKLLHPDRGTAETLRRQRRSGWGLVLTGIALIVALIIAPTDEIELWSGVVGVGGLSLILVDTLSHGAPGTGQERTDHGQSTIVGSPGTELEFAL